MIQAIADELASQSLGALCRKVLRHTGAAVRRSRRRHVDRYKSTYAPAAPGGPLARLIPDLDAAPFLPHAQRVRALSSLYCEHRFDILGSGWVGVDYGRRAGGFEGVVYPPPSGTAVRLLYPESRAIWSLLDDADYRPIDWHRDHKSGYRWSEELHSSDIRPGPAPGADVKGPWELARMHHLPVLAYAFALASVDIEGFQPADRYAKEFRSELLDFLATNPPRRGINWACTMDVAIRIANCLVAYDLFRAFGYRFDAECEHTFARAVYEHALYCATHLETSATARGNHFVADIAGLLLSAAYLPRTDETDGWLSFAVCELAAEVLQQFHEDGSHYEGATCYHGLTLDIVAHAALFCVAMGPDARAALRRRSHADVLPDEPGVFSSRFWSRLGRATRFLADLRRPDGAVPQFGDNDSGRFLKLWPTYERLAVADARRRYRSLHDDAVRDLTEYWDENVLDYDSTIIAGALLTGQEDCIGANAQPLAALLTALRGGTWRPPACDTPVCPAGEPIDFATADAHRGPIARAPIVTEFRARPGQSLREGLRIAAYPGMGVYVFRSPRLYLAVRCGEVGQLGNGGHAHNDQLSFELVLDDADHVRDPGTYVYSPSVELRNQFRSISVHFTPRVGAREQNRWRPGQRGLFSLVRPLGGRCEYVGADGFVGSHRCFGHEVVRRIEIRANVVVVTDHGADSAGTIPQVFANGYGRWRR